MDNMKLPNLPLEQNKHFRKCFQDAVKTHIKDANVMGFTNVLAGLENIICIGSGFRHSSEASMSRFPFAEELVQQHVARDLFTALYDVLKKAEKMQYYELCANIKVLMDEIEIHLPV